MTQTVFTVITKVDPAKVDALKAVLDEIGADAAHNGVLPLAGFDTLHFASMVLAQGGALPPTLIFEQNVDGELDDWLPVLVSGARPGLDAVYANCVGFPGGGSEEEVRAYLAEHAVRPGAYHIGATGRSLARIRQEAVLRNAIEGHLDSQVAAGTLPADPGTVRSSVQTFVQADPGFSWANTSPPRETKLAHYGHVARLVAFIVVAAVLVLTVLWPFLIVWVVVLRIKEATDPVQTVPADPAQIQAIARTEDFIAQNHLASVIPVKPGFLRAVTLPVVLYALNLVARVTATKGQLAGIPSIHFAHWSRINDGKHLLFLSNFDGSWESYLGDFIDKAATGLTAVWSNTVDFPRTRFLIHEGATDGPAFRQWARAHQCPTNVWYSAYPESTMPIIDNNTSIREGLYRSMQGTEVQAWLRRL
jgi:hypothetical protein